MPSETAPKQARVLRNVTCPYCAADLTSSPWSKEHLIGRRFVPKGSLNAAWNLILRACERCNNLKSDLEDDISAIAMQPDSFGRFGREDPKLRQESLRKAANSVSRRTGRPVADSQQTLRLRGSMGQGITMEFTLTAPPALHHERIFSLACLQLSGLFYWLTYHRDESRGYFWLGEFAPLQYTLRGDWGNAQAVAFMRDVLSWQDRLILSTANGYFKAAIRRHPADAVCWSWALEWNENVRVIGFIGEPGPVAEAVSCLPQLDGVEVARSATGVLRSRREVPLDAAEDCLFD